MRQLRLNGSDKSNKVGPKGGGSAPKLWMGWDGMVRYVIALNTMLMAPGDFSATLACQGVAGSPAMGGRWSAPQSG